MSVKDYAQGASNGANKRKSERVPSWVEQYAERGAVKAKQKNMAYKDVAPKGPGPAAKEDKPAKGGKEANACTEETSPVTPESTKI